MVDDLPIALSEYGRASTRPAPVSRMMGDFAADFRDRFDVNLGVGYVSDEVLPRQLIETAMREVLADPKTHHSPLNYGGPAGSPNLIDAIRRFHVDHHVGKHTAATLDRRRIVIGVSGATSLLDALAQVLRPGLVITTDPIYYIFANQLERMGYQIVAVPEDDHGMRVDLLSARLDAMSEAERQRLSFAYIVSVNNPSCTILANDRRHRIVDCFTDLSRRIGRQVPVVFDTAYEGLIHDQSVPPVESGLLHDEAGIAWEIGTLSKILAPALRVGYLIASPGPLVDAVVQKTSDTGFSGPLLTQEIAARLLDHHLADQLPRSRAVYREKATAVRRWIDQYLGRHVEHDTGGRAGFYFYLTLRGIETHERSPLFRELTRKREDMPRVIYVPGEHCVHRGGELAETARRQLRLSYGYETLDQIHRGIRRIAEVIDQLPEATGS